ncbi:hypothetical protein [Candidatus Manganitrophus noduliformans]|uniref:Uncharacterized protein n=1 Tax=Candidatus Manganitrophus noduliformans TaxID=2606439 RepID=A0A7X6DMA3_9BACT|nr:hypothetical protein [Candidatus Manganitrophus noduliformans]NKE69841.1 hypothetical protein [Candidatus Manganitrophus noduliformans]
MKKLTIEEAAELTDGLYKPATLRYFIKRKILRRITVPGGEGEFIKVGTGKSSPVRIIEERFRIWLHKRTYPGDEADRRGVPMAAVGRR